MYEEYTREEVSNLVQLPVSFHGERYFEYRIHYFERIRKYISYWKKILVIFGGVFFKPQLNQHISVIVENQKNSQ